MTQATRSFSLGGSSRLGLLLAGALAAITGLLIFAALRNSGDGGTKTVAGGSETAVVVARQDIPARTAIQPDMVEVVRVPSNALLGGAFSSKDVTIGRVARIPIYKGEQLVQDKLATTKTDLGLSYIIPEGHVGFAVKIDKVIGAGGLIRPGDRVDVIGVADVKISDLATDKSVSDTRSFYISQNVEVLAVEQKLENRPAAPQKDGANDGTLVDQPAADSSATVVTLALTPEDAPKVLLVDEKGKIRLAVRASGDTSARQGKDTTFIQLVDPESQKAILDALRAKK